MVRGRGEALEVVAERTALERLLARAAARSQVVAAGAIAECGSAGDGGGAELEEQRRFDLVQDIGGEGVVLRQHAARSQCP
jgi:hypothetical protein